VPDRSSSGAQPTQAVILAGGRGTRLLPLTETCPKPMVEIAGRPFIEHTIEMLREQGIDRVLLLLGHLADVVIDHLGDGSRLGVTIEYSVTGPDDLTSHRLQVAAPLIDDVFLLLYCDNYWPMQMDEMWAQFVASGAEAQLTVYANDDGYSRSNIAIDKQGMVQVYDPSRSAPDLEGVEIGYALLRKEVVLDLLPEEQVLFERAVYPALVERGALGGFVTGHRYYSVGSHERLPLTEAFLARRPAIILDRDGVLNERPPRAQYVTSPEGLRWLPGSLEALRLLHEAGYLVCVVTNQAGIGRGVMSADDLEAVHSRLLADAGAAGGHIDAIYHCPHDWDDGCSCRKPRPGMLFAAQRDHHLDLSRTYFIGDDERDAEAALAAGCPSALVGGDVTLLDLIRRLLSGAAEGARA
jgi:histidinol-phosphate phosphatase family protein